MTIEQLKANFSFEDTTTDIISTALVNNAIYFAQSQGEELNEATVRNYLDSHSVHEVIGMLGNELTELGYTLYNP